MSVTEFGMELIEDMSIEKHAVCYPALNRVDS